MNYKIENKIKSLKNALAVTEDANASLKLQVDSSHEGLQQALAALKRCEDALANSTAELHERNAITATENVQAWAVIRVS